MVVEPQANGLLRPVELEQVKAGTKPAEIGEGKDQNNKAYGAMQKIAAGDRSYQIFDRTGKNRLGANRTADFDLTALDPTKQHVRALPGRGDEADIRSGMVRALDMGSENMGADNARLMLEEIARALFGEQVAHLAGIEVTK